MDSEREHVFSPHKLARRLLRAVATLRAQLAYKPRHQRPVSWAVVSARLGSALVVIASLLTVLPLAAGNQPAQALGGATATTSYNPSVDGTTSNGTWTKGGTGCAAGFYACLNDYPDSGSTNWLQGPPNVTGAYRFFTFGSLAANLAQVTSVGVVFGWARTSSGSDHGFSAQFFAPNETAAISTVGATGNITSSNADYNVTVTPTAANTGKAIWDKAHLQLLQSCTACNSGNFSKLTAIQITVHYITTGGQLTQAGYIFENDDQVGAANANSDTAQVAGNTAITGVKTGERVTTRIQLKDAANTTSANFGVFYDRSDSYWTKVRSAVTPITTAGSCADTNFACTAVDTAVTGLSHTSVAVDNLGHPWASYYDSANGNLDIATYVGTGGTGCASTAWSCQAIATTGDVGKYNSIAIDSQNNVWVAYWDTGNKLYVAKNVAGTGCAVTTWTCTQVASPTMSATGADAVSIAMDPSGAPWIAYHDSAATNGSIYLARYVTSGGSGCFTAAWDGCGTVIQTNAGQEIALAIDGNGNPWLAEWDFAGKLEVDHEVGSAGTGCSIGVSWSCVEVDTTASAGQWPSIGVDSSGNAWVSYYDGTNHTLKVATYLGAAGSCSSALWNCSTVDSSSALIGTYTSLTFDPAGNPWVTYYDSTNHKLRLARDIAGAWTTTSVDTAAGDDTGSWSSLAIGPDGTAWIPTVDATTANLRVANLNHSGELTVAPGLAGNVTGSAVSITTSHADMTSVGDSTDQASANCIGGGTFTNGTWFQSEENSSQSIPSGDCTELGFILDTSQSQQNTTYRLVVATKDSYVASRSYWRGPATISQYPTLTTGSTTTTRISKDNLASGSTDCTNTNWTCMQVDNIANTKSTGDSSSMAFDAGGVPWVAYHDLTDTELKYATYVGSGLGSGCIAATSWKCGIIDAPGHDVGAGQMSMAFDPSGSAWVVYQDSNASFLDLKVAHYVGTGGNCGGSTAWNCWQVDTTGNVGTQANIAIDPSGNPWISYVDNTNSKLKVANYVPDGNGSGCNTTSWSCMTLSPTTAKQSAIGFDNNGTPWLIYQNTAALDLIEAQYVGTGGSGCATGVDDWTCFTLDNSVADEGEGPSLAIDSSGVPWIAFRDNTNKHLMTAHYVGSGGVTCTSSKWDCQTADAGADVGSNTSIAVDANGNPWVGYKDNAGGKKRVAQYIGSGGGSAANCGVGSNAAWSCSVLWAAASTSGNSGMAIDRSNTPWITTMNTTNTAMMVAKLKLPSGIPTYSTSGANRANNGLWGDNRYRLDAGLSARPATCAATANYQGYCGVASNDASYDSVDTTAYESPVYTAALQVGSNASFPSVKWIGQSTVNAATANILLQVYRFGTINAWQTISTNSTTTANTAITFNGVASAGSASEYWDADGANYWTYWRTYQGASASATTLKTNQFVSTMNNPPNAATALLQTTAADVTIATGAWTAGNNPKFKATASDPDAADTLYLCVEYQLIGTGFANANTQCGSGVAYSGTPVALVVQPVSMSDGVYHWQVRVEDAAGAFSSWLSYGSNLESVTDIGIDATAPATGTATDSANTGSLTIMGATYSGFSDATSGILKYQYAIGITVGGTTITSGWIDNGTGTTVAATGLTLVTSQTYYVSIRAVDNAGNTSAVITSIGQRVAPTLTFSVAAHAGACDGVTQTANASATGTLLTFGLVTQAANSIATQDLSVTTNGNKGFTVYVRTTGQLYNGHHFLSNASGTNAAPAAFPAAGTEAFGYTTSDSTLGTGTPNRFTNPSAQWAALTASNVEVSYNAAATVGTNTACMAYQMGANSGTSAGLYTTQVVYTAVPGF